MKNKIIKYSIYYILFTLMIISVFTMYVGRLYSDMYQNYYIKEIIYYFIAFIVLFITIKIPKKIFIKYAYLIYLINLILLVLVLIIGKEINGSKAWINFGFLSIQPSEFMKISLIILFTRLVSIKLNVKKIMLMILLVLIPSILIFIEPDTGGIIPFIIILIYYICNYYPNKKVIYTLLFIGLLFILLNIYLYIVNKDIFINIIGSKIFYRLDRIINFKNNSGIQINNALASIGSSSLFGSGLNTKYLYFPFSVTDFSFALLTIHFGFIGGIITTFLLLLLNYLLLKISTKENRIIVIILFIYEIESILMNLGLLPIIGIPLPFISYGGSSLLVNMFLIGLILNTKKASL